MSFPLGHMLRTLRVVPILPLVFFLFWCVHWGAPGLRPALLLAWRQQRQRPMRGYEKRYAQLDASLRPPPSARTLSLMRTPMSYPAVCTAQQFAGRYQGGPPRCLRGQEFVGGRSGHLRSEADGPCHRASASR